MRSDFIFDLVEQGKKVRVTFSNNPMEDEDEYKEGCVIEKIGENRIKIKDYYYIWSDLDSNREPMAEYTLSLEEFLNFVFQFDEYLSVCVEVL